MYVCVVAVITNDYPIGDTREAREGGKRATRARSVPIDEEYLSRRRSAHSQERAFFFSLFFFLSTTTQRFIVTRTSREMYTEEEIREKENESERERERQRDTNARARLIGARHHTLETRHTGTGRESYLFIANGEKSGLSPGQRSGWSGNAERIARAVEAGEPACGPIRRCRNTANRACNGRRGARHSGTYVRAKDVTSQEQRARFRPDSRCRGPAQRTRPSARRAITPTYDPEILYIARYRHLPVISLRSSSFEISAMVDATRCACCCQLSLCRLRTPVASVGTVPAKSAPIRARGTRPGSRITRKRSRENEYYIHQIVLVFYARQVSHDAPRVIRRSECADSYVVYGSRRVLFRLTVRQAAARGCRWRPRYSPRAPPRATASRKIAFAAR